MAIAICALKCPFPRWFVPNAHNRLYYTSGTHTNWARNQNIYQNIIKHSIKIKMIHFMRSKWRIERRVDQWKRRRETERERDSERPTAKKVAKKILYFKLVLNEILSGSVWRTWKLRTQPPRKGHIFCTYSRRVRETNILFGANISLF